ncbi:MAG: hypothetical protein M1813_002555 [Trichoglossum hirsutum]|nr:MAG: hypothetical protein M1813_002555 [Trichoglossum hirsutum]
MYNVLRAHYQAPDPDHEIQFELDDNVAWKFTVSEIDWIGLAPQGRSSRLKRKGKGNLAQGSAILHRNLSTGCGHFQWLRADDQDVDIALGHGSGYFAMDYLTVYQLGGEIGEYKALPSVAGRVATFRDQEILGAGVDASFKEDIILSLPAWIGKRALMAIALPWQIVTSTFRTAAVGPGVSQK